MIGRTISHYRIIEEIGHGGMGVVYKAHNTRPKRQKSSAKEKVKQTAWVHSEVGFNSGRSAMFIE